MRNRTRTAQLARIPTSRARTRRTWRSVIDWFRTGYPDDAPSNGYSPLLALAGQLALTPRETQSVIAELAGVHPDSVNIEVAITKATGRLPNQSQVRAVARALTKRA